MAIQQGTLAERQSGRFGLHLGRYVGGIVYAGAVKIPVQLAIRALVGRESGPRGYMREKFPESQWQEILAGRRNWFD